MIGLEARCYISTSDVTKDALRYQEEIKSTVYFRVLLALCESTNIRV